MTTQLLRKLSPCLTLLAMASSPAMASAQAKSFEVVSIRQNVSGGNMKQPPQLTPSANGFHVTRIPLEMVLMTAYTPKSSTGALFVNNVENLPEWANRENYDIDARVSDADRAEWQNPANQPAMLQSMLQTMLADRFKLAVHRSTKEVPVYLLTVAKGGPKFSETKPDDPRPAGLTLPGGGVMVQTRTPSGEAANLYNFSMGLLTSLLGTQSDRPIQDKTGLTGRYDMFIHKPGRMQAPSATADSGSDSEPSIFSVTQEIGLKLSPAKDQVETLVIDHIDHPSEN